MFFAYNNGITTTASDVKIENNKINITVRTEKLPEVIKKLAIADTEIQLVIPKEHTLEDIFFDATERGVK